MNLFLIGYRCTGKSTVGKILAQRLKRPFIDTDKLITDEQGCTIDAIIKQRGWDFFRSIETDTIKRVCADDNRVVATGGGAVLAPQNVRLMQNNGVLIWLQATPETIRLRMAQDSATASSRPALTSGTSLEEIEETLATRDSFYTKAMNFAVDTDHKGIDNICTEIITWLCLEKRR
ncbi:shikimate kinase [Desulfococcaceae bacterium HSG7]|nr:shikimate kinase [Desulfococcaceae bacterium HSG7]